MTDYKVAIRVLEKRTEEIHDYLNEYQYVLPHVHVLSQQEVINELEEAIQVLKVEARLAGLRSNDE